MLRCATFGLLQIFLTGSLFYAELNAEGVEPTVPWYENLPAVAMDYKVHIDPGKEDCYFQYVNKGATFYVSFQVCESITFFLMKFFSYRANFGVFRLVFVFYEII